MTALKRGGEGKITELTHIIYQNVAQMLKWFICELVMVLQLSSVVVV